MSAAAIELTPESPHQALHQAIATALRDLSTYSEREVLEIGGRVGHMVELAEAHVETLNGLQDTLQLDRLGELSQEQHQRLTGVLDRIAVCMRAQMEQVEALSEIATHVLATHMSLRRGIQSARLLSVHVRVEGAVLASQGMEINGLAAKLLALGQRMEGASEDVVALIGVLSEALPALLRRLREGLVRSEELRRSMWRHSRSINKAAAQLSGGLSDRFAACLKQVERAVSASHRALSALQFQDPMIQALQRLDPLMAEARRDSGELDAEPFYFGAGFAHDAAHALYRDDEEDAPAAGEALLF